MPIRTIIFTLMLFATVGTSAQKNQDAASAAKAWWRALTFGDTAYLKKYSAKNVTVTLSIGKSYDLKALIAQASLHNPLANINLDWSEEVLQHTSPKSAILTNMLLEKIGAGVSPLRLITVVVKEKSGWKIAAAQSTKQTELSNRIPLSSAGKPEDYAGKYKTPAGTILHVSVRDSSLVLTDPSGTETLLEPIAYGIFEPPRLHLAGNIRIVFSRDSMGNVTALNRVANKVISMPRVR